MSLKPRIVATIEARMTSTRLPGKVLLPAADRPMLAHLIRRLKQVPSLHEIVVATTTNDSDDPVATLAKQEGAGVFRGSEEDVLGRVLGAGSAADADIIVEITGDCPVIDSEIVEQTLRVFLLNNADYVSNAHVRSYPIGMDTQVFRLETLARSAAATNDPKEREHVTLHIRRNPDLFSHIVLAAPPSLHAPDLRLTLDEKGDYELLSRIIEHFLPHNPSFSCGEILDLLAKNPSWIDLNRHVKQKTVVLDQQPDAV